VTAAGASVGEAVTRVVSDAALPTAAEVVAIGWTTVELDRAAEEIVAALPAAGPFVDAADDVLLGARCRVGPSGLGRPAIIVLLEPSTEGPISASLARHGEAFGAVWIRIPSDHDGAAPRTSAAGDGPLGSERRLLRGAEAGRPPWPGRLHVLVLEDGPGTIAR